MSALAEDFRFIEETHTYLLDGVVLPSITRVLDLTGFVDKSWFTEGSRQRGTDIHLACRFLAEGDLDWGTVRPEYMTRVRGFEKFLGEIGSRRVLLAEKPLVSLIHGFAGTPDFLFDARTQGGTLWLPDVKTGKSGLAAELQTAAQEILIRESMPDIVPATARIQRFALELPEAGGYRLVPHEDPKDSPMFLNALAMVYRRINAGELSL